MVLDYQVVMKDLNKEVVMLEDMVKVDQVEDIVVQ